jgi:predicted TIM-barrel fold metal-dependent hydrolase
MGLNDQGSAAALLAEPKIDTHCHLLDPARFPYAADVAYRPQGQEMGDQASFEQVMDFHGVRHALLVGPNSGYNLDNRCLLHALSTGNGRFKGVVVLPNDASQERLLELRSQGVVGVAFNVALRGVDFYRDIGPLLSRLGELGMWAQFQVEGDQLLEMLPLIEACDTRLLFDHYGRPVASAGTEQAGFQALLALGREGRAVVKLSGEAKFAEAGFPFMDTRPFLDALLDNFGLERCIWASDWPYLKAPFRLDYGPMLQRWNSLLTPAQRRQVMWQNPVRLFGFEG